MTTPDWRDELKPGAVIVEREPHPQLGLTPRRVVEVDGDRIETETADNDRRRGWMNRGNLRYYELVSP